MATLSLDKRLVSFLLIPIATAPALLAASDASTVSVESVDSTPVAGVGVCVGDTGAPTAQRTIPRDRGSAPRADLTLRPELSETIVVTARKREERLIDVPMSVSTVSATAMEERAMATFLESAQGLANVVIESTNSSFPGISIRGITNSNALGFEPAVGVYLDEVYLPQPAAIDKLLIDAERIEVLRGPQGTAFGKNTVGGVVNLVTSRPSSKVKAALELTAGRFDLRQLRGSLGGPVSRESLSAKIAFGLQDRDGWLENRTVGLPDLMSEDSIGGRGQVRWSPSRSTEVLVSADFSENEDIQNAPEITSGPLFALDGGNAFDRSVATNELPFHRREILGGSVRAEVGSVRHLLTSLTSYRAFEYASFQDQDATALDLVTTGTREQLDYFSQELRLASTGGKPLSYLAGLYYADGDHDSRFSASLGAAVPPLFGLPPISGFEERVETTGSVTERNLAGFFSANWAFHPRATLELGARLSDERKELDYHQAVSPFFVGPGFPVGLAYGLAADVAPLAEERSDTEPSGAISLLYSVGPEVNAYFRVARGFKAGGFSTGLATVADPADREFDNEIVDAYEVGIKSLFGERRVRLNVAAFYLDYRDKQERIWTGAQFLVRNAAEATSKGLEVEAIASPISGLETRLGVGYTDASYTHFIDALLGDFSGNRLIDAPDWTGSLGVQYYRPISQASAWFFGAEASYRADNFKTFDNDPRFEQVSHLLVHARTGVELRGGRYSVALWGKNLTGEDYLLGGFELLGTTYGFVNSPPTYAVELRFRL